MNKFQSLFLKCLLITLFIPWTFGYKTFKNKTFRIAAKHSSKDGDNLFTYHYDEETLRSRVPDYPIHPIILSRRPLYEQTGEPLTDEELFPLFEAFRWGASFFNTQPWRIVYSHRETPCFKEFTSFIGPHDKDWVKISSVLMVIITNMYNIHKGKEMLMNSPLFCGLAFSGMALEANGRGLVTHLIHAEDEKGLTKVLDIDNDPHYRLVVMVSIGKRVPPSEQGKLDDRDESITQRKKLSDIVSKGIFKKTWLN